MLSLEDLKNYSEEYVKQHIVGHYKASQEEVDKFEISIAYESVGSWGCDSSSFFLLRNKETSELFEVHGSHCSCYGFEGQFNPEYTIVEALKYRAEKRGVFSVGGYDNDRDRNIELVNEFILKMEE